MTIFKDFNRDQDFLLPPSLKDWLPEDDLAHFVIAATERVSLAAFKVNPRNAGKPQYHPRMMLALLIYCYSNGIFSSRRIERATYRDVGVRFIAADRHPDHDTIATFRRTNTKAFEDAFCQVLLMARESGLLKLGTVSIDGTKIDANASKIRSVRYDRMMELRQKLTDDIAALMRQAEAADAEGTQLIVSTNMATTPSDQPTFAETILSMAQTIGLPKTVLADAGFASRDPVLALKERGIEPLIAISAIQPQPSLRLPTAARSTQART